MLGRIRFIVIYFCSWVVFFEAARLVFLLYHFKQSRSLPFSVSLQTFFYGLRMDASMAAYFTLPVCIFVIIGVLVPLLSKAILYKIYTSLLVIAVMLIICVDLEAYRQWGFRLDATPLKYLGSPREAWASVSHLPLFGLFLLMVTLVGLVIAMFNRILARELRFSSLPIKQGLFTVVTIVILAASLLIPIRGGLQQTPMNQSGVYFSTYNFANHAAINATWNFMQGVLAFGDIARNPYQYLSMPEAKTIVDSLHSSAQKSEQVLHTRSPNLILIIWESLTQKALNWKIGGKEILPHFNSLRNEGLYFSNVYASGDRTDKGLGALLSAYPALPSTSILRDVNKAAQLPFLSTLFQNKGYRTPFYYGGEPEFANIKSYLLNAKFSPIIEKKDFAARDQNSKWGAHDGVVAKRIAADLQRIRQPFMATWLTLTSHEPFETPKSPVFSGEDQTTRFLNSMHYTDEVIGEFIAFCKKQSWWDETLIVIVADHGHPLPETGKKEDNFRIPMLWLGGALKTTPGIREEVTSQLDLAPTLAAQVGSEQKFPFGKNIFNATSKQWAFFTFNDGWGFASGARTTVYDNVGKQLIRQTGLPDSLDVRRGQALQQYLYQDYLDR